MKQRAHSRIMDIRKCPTCGDPMAPVYACGYCVYEGDGNRELQINENGSPYGRKEDKFHRKLTFYHADSEWIRDPDDLKPLMLTVVYSTKHDPDSINFRIQIYSFLDLDTGALRRLCSRPKRFQTEFARVLEDFIMADFGYDAGYFIGLSRTIKFHLSEHG